ncbi:MAG: MATE family efflux transporter [Lentisphaeria bacterium]|nr:MATE family efflux transporter [Lentisphaeria bacterium]
MTADTKKAKSNYTKGSIGGTMLKTGFAMLAGTLAMSGYNIVDTYFVGNLGKIPMAAMGFTMPIIMLVGCFFRGLTIGVMATSAQSLGGGKHGKANNLIFSGIALITAISLAAGICGLFVSEYLIRLMNASDAALPLAKEYMDIWFLGCVTAFVGLTGNDLLISSGYSRTASTLMVAGLVLNTILDPLFIFGMGPVPAMGMKGAALATVVAQACSAATALTVLHHKGLFVLKVPAWKIMNKAWLLIIKYAIPSSLGMLMMPLGSFVITWITAKFGDAAVAATAAAARLEMLAFVFPMALGISLMPMVGQNFGAKLYGRIRACKRFSFLFAFFFLLMMAVIYFFLADLLVKQFSPDPEVRKIMAICMRIIPWGFWATEIHRYSGFFFTGCGHPRISAYLNGFRMIGLLLPFSFIALYFNNLEGLFWARFAADILAGFTGMYLASGLVKNLPEEDGKTYDGKHIWQDMLPFLKKRF